MLMPRVIPCLDVRGGRVVKGVRFQGLRDAGDPLEQAARYEADGADEIVLLDVSATVEERAAALDVVARVRAVLSIPLAVGGGVRAVADAARLLDAGADKVGVNSAAVARPELLAELADRFGRQCVVASVDAARTEPAAGDGRGARPDAPAFEVVVRAGTKRTGIDAAGWSAEAARLGAGEILLTSWDRDGTGTGYEVELLAAVAGAVEVPVIASGGGRTVDHMRAALDAGADAVLAASIFHDAETTVADVKRALASAGVPVRPPDGAPAERTDAAPSATDRTEVTR